MTQYKSPESGHCWFFLYHLKILHDTEEKNAENQQGGEGSVISWATQSSFTDKNNSKLT